MLKLKLDQLRTKLDQMNEKIISRLVDRSRYKLNHRIYKKDAIFIRDRHGISFLEFALEGLENYHSLLGRYNFPDQYPIIINPKESSVKKIVTQWSIPRVKIDIGKDIIKFYTDSLKGFCLVGEDQTTYGETAYCDADIIQLLNERINLGRYVAETKLRSGFLEKKGAEKNLISKLRDPKREKELIKKVQQIAIRYGLNPKVAGKYFKWIIGETLKIEVSYLKKSKPKTFKA